MKLKTTFTILAVSTMLPMGAFAADTAAKPAVQAANPAQTKEEFIQRMGSQVLTILKDSKHSFAECQATLRGMFVGAVDTDWIAKFVLGKAWRDATPEQQAKYTELYRTYLTETYISKFDEDSGSKVQDIKINGIKQSSQDTFTAHTEILQSGGEPPVKVDYLLRMKDGQYKIIDINIEGVSLLATHRQEFNALAGQNGIDGVIKKLTELTTHQQQAK